MATYSKAIKVTVDGPREPRSKTRHQGFHPFHFGPRFHDPLMGGLPFKLSGKFLASLRYRWKIFATSRPTRVDVSIPCSSVGCHRSWIWQDAIVPSFLETVNFAFVGRDGFWKCLCSWVGCGRRLDCDDREIELLFVFRKLSMWRCVLWVSTMCWFWLSGNYQEFKVMIDKFISENIYV